jgi:hypothetical protein
MLVKSLFPRLNDMKTSSMTVSGPCPSSGIPNRSFFKLDVSVLSEKVGSMY